MTQLFRPGQKVSIRVEKPKDKYRDVTEGIYDMRLTQFGGHIVRIGKKLVWFSDDEVDTAAQPF